MRTIEMKVRIEGDRKLVLEMPPDIAPGRYRIVLVIEGQTVTEDHSLLDFPVVDCGPWPENLSLRREDIYDDFGR